MKIFPFLRRLMMGLPLPEELCERIAAGLEGEPATSAGAPRSPFTPSPAAESEFPKDLIKINVPEDILLAVALPELIRSEAFVLLAFFWIAQHGVGFADLLELLLRLAVSGVPVGVIPVSYTHLRAHETR